MHHHSMAPNQWDTQRAQQDENVYTLQRQSAPARREREPTPPSCPLIWRIFPGRKGGKNWEKLLHTRASMCAPPDNVNSSASEPKDTGGGNAKAVEWNCSPKQRMTSFIFFVNVRKCNSVEQTQQNEQKRYGRNEKMWRYICKDSPFSQFTNSVQFGTGSWRWLEMEFSEY